MSDSVTPPPSNHLRPCGATGVCTPNYSSRAGAHGGRRAGPNVSSHLIRPSLIFYPGMLGVVDVYGKDDQGKYVPTQITMGVIFVVNGKNERYIAAGGPPPSEGRTRGDGGHVAGRTPPGDYILGKRERHTSSTWPNSVIPYGAELRQVGIETEYKVDNRWHLASGPHGAMTRVLIAFEEKTNLGRPLSRRRISEIIELSRLCCLDDDGNLYPKWEKNDFGMWSWNLTRNGVETVYFVHTTPDDEHVTSNLQGFTMSQSHGCVHIRPTDRNEMMNQHYLEAGVHFTIKPYSAKPDYKHLM